MESSSWAGFSDRDLKQLKGHPSAISRPERNEIRNHGRDIKKADLNTGTKKARTQNERRTIQKSLSPPADDNKKLNLSPSERLSSPTKSGEDNRKPTKVQSQKEETKNVQGDHASEEAVKVSEVEIGTEELDETEVLSREMGNLDKFRQQQKQIEEGNKQKKALLTKALAERRKRAKAETVKLAQIQQDVKHIDTLLTADVSLIRDRIEEASREYMEAQRRYQKAETEFIQAKMDLFDKCEMKGQLTEHLYTIIHQNEVRKAKKLAELMSQLEMELSAEELENIENVEHSLPPLSMFMSNTSCQTLHSPTSPIHRPQVPPINTENTVTPPHSPKEDVSTTASESTKDQTSASEIQVTASEPTPQIITTRTLDLTETVNQKTLPSSEPVADCQDTGGLNSDKAISDNGSANIEKVSIPEADSSGDS